MLEPKRFSSLWMRLGGTGDPGPLLAEFAAAYGQPHRAYHNARHILECLDQLDRAGLLAERPDEVEMAIWFHDAVYDPHASDNEERSAQWAVRALTEGGVAPSAVTRIADLIRATRHEAPATGKDEALLCDVDLSILGRSELVFDEYDRNIRLEYEWVPEPAYRQGRRKVLERFLERASIFQTGHFRMRYEEQARRNLERALVRLAEPGSAAR